VIPAVTQSWTISANNRYLFGTVQGATQAYVFSIKQFLKVTMGYTVKGSSSAGTGAMDGVDRWSATSDVTPRNNGASGSQAWVVLTNGDAADICLSYNSSSDDVFRIAFSPGGVFVAAGTANQQPTAVDECFESASGTWGGTQGTFDRVWHHWGTSDKRMWRSAIFRDGSMVSAVGTERLVSTVVSPAAFVGPAMYKFFYTQGAVGDSSGALGIYNAATGGGVARVHASDQDVNISLGGGGEMYGGFPGASTFNVEKPPLQGGCCHIVNPVCLYSTTATGDGKLGMRIDWWFAFTFGVSVPSDWYGRLVTVVAQMIWPWDMSTIMQVS
jgi:hypothetical protein